MFETITFEVLLNISFFALSGVLMFYYLPSDLWHVTSVQTLPFYFVLSIAVMKLIKRMKSRPAVFSVLSLFLMIVVVYL